MGILDKMKGAMDSVTGGAAAVTLEHTGAFTAGQVLKLKITATSTGREVKVRSVHVDLRGKGKGLLGQAAGNVMATANHTFTISDGLTLAAKESRVIEGELTVPAIDAALDWEIRARLDTVGNDPDSGFVDIR